jgi:hypothetical protein
MAFRTGSIRTYEDRRLRLSAGPVRKRLPGGAKGLVSRPLLALRRATPPSGPTSALLVTVTFAGISIVSAFSTTGLQSHLVA